MLKFSTTEPPVPPKPAATVIVLREGGAAGGVEIFCVRRHAASGFLGGAVVFPGGKVDASDADPAWATRATAPHPRVEDLLAPFTLPEEVVMAAARAGAASSDAASSDAGRGRAIAVAACREALEEGAILPATGEGRGSIDAAAARAIRADVYQPRRTPDAGPPERALVTLAHALEVSGFRLELGWLVPWARWVTPAAESRRFDARFFLLALPEGQLGEHDEHETTESFWASPAVALERFERGEIFLAPPTTRTFELLRTVTSVPEALELAGRQDLAPICPRFGMVDDVAVLALPGDPLHEDPVRRVAGPTRFVLRDGKFLSEDPLA